MQHGRRRLVLGALILATVALATLTTLAATGTILSRAIHVEGRAGGTLEIVFAGRPQELDPARVDDITSAMLLRATIRTPYTWRPDRPLAPVPDLARGVPEIDQGGRRVTVHLRGGVRFAPPVSREVRSEDVAYAISRGFRPGVDSEPARRWFDDVEGVDEVASGRAVIASGLRTPDARTLVIRLRRPVGRLIAEALTLEMTAPVPREYAERFDAQPRSTYARHQVATGPYRFDRAGGGLALVRNPSWNPRTDDRPAFLDRMVVREEAGSRVEVLRRVLDGRRRVSGDVAPFKSDLRGRTPARRAQVEVGSAGSVLFLALNTQAPPFDDVHVRRAATAAADQALLRDALGAPTGGEIPTHWLPPGIPGFEQAGGRRGPGLPFLEAPAGDLELARAEMRAAGFASGRYDGPARPVLAAPGSAQARAAVEAFARRLRLLGIRTRLRELDDPREYLAACTAPRADAPSCLINWVPELRDPQALLQPLFSSEARPTSFSRLRDAELDRMMDAAETEQGRADRAKAWAEVDRRVSALAPGVPIEWGADVNARSADVRAYLDPGTGSWALPYLSLR